MRRSVSSRLQEYPFLSKVSWLPAVAILFVVLKKTARLARRGRGDVIILDYSEYSAPQSRMLGIHSMYSGIGIATQSNAHSGSFL